MQAALVFYALLCSKNERKKG
eukprot:COSAG06_NODE_48925_length_328_cov_15.192140_1_plen_20_part_10